MSKRGPYRRHSAQFKLQLCQEIRSGGLGRRDARHKYSLSANLSQLWLTQFERGELTGKEVEAATLVDYEARAARVAGRGPAGALPIIPRDATAVDPQCSPLLGPFQWQRFCRQHEFDVHVQRLHPAHDLLHAVRHQETAP